MLGVQYEMFCHLVRYNNLLKCTVLSDKDRAIKGLVVCLLKLIPWILEINIPNYTWLYDVTLQCNGQQPSPNELFDNFAEFA